MLSTKFLLKKNISINPDIFTWSQTKFIFLSTRMNEEKLPSLIHTCWTSAYTPQILPCVQRNTFDTSHFEKLRDILGQCFDCVDSVFSRCKHWVQRALAVCCRLRMKLLKLLWINLSSGNSRSYSCIEKIHGPFPMWASFKCLTKMKPNRTQK